MHLIYLIHEFHNLSWITEINELFHNILIYWDAPVCSAHNSKNILSSFYHYLLTFMVFQSQSMSNFLLQNIKEKKITQYALFFFFCHFIGRYRKSTWKVEFRAPTGLECKRQIACTTILLLKWFIYYIKYYFSPKPIGELGKWSSQVYFCCLLTMYCHCIKFTQPTIHLLNFMSLTKRD